MKNLKSIEVINPEIIKTEYDVISPDGFSIHRENTYKSKEEAIIAFNNWKDNYKGQGYYSSVKYGRIPLSELEEYCKIIELN